MQEDFRWCTNQLQRRQRKKPGTLKDMLRFIDAHVTCFRPSAGFVRSMRQALQRERANGGSGARALLMRIRRLQKRRLLSSLQYHRCARLLLSCQGEEEEMQIRFSPQLSSKDLLYRRSPNVCSEKAFA